MYLNATRDLLASYGLILGEGIQLPAREGTIVYHVLRL